MTDDADDLDRRLARLFEAGRRKDPEDHPAPEKLSAYQAKELPPEEADAIQEHLVQCAFCTDLLLDLQRFLEPEEEDRAQEGLADLGAEVGWRKVREEMGWRGRRLPSKSPSQPFFASAVGGYSIAAALFVAIVGLAVWNMHLSREMRRPQPVISMTTLEAAGSVRSGISPEGGGAVELPTEVILNLPTESPERVYHIDFLPYGKDRPVWSVDMRSQGAALSVFLPRKALPPGRYALRVSALGSAAGSWTYELSITSPDR